MDCTIGCIKTVIYLNTYITPLTIFSSPSLLFPWERGIHSKWLGPRVISRSKMTEWLALWTMASYSTAWWVCQGIISTWLSPSITRSMFNCCPSFPFIWAHAVRRWQAFSSLHLDNVSLTCTVLVALSRLFFWTKRLRTSNTQNFWQICKFPHEIPFRIARLLKKNLIFLEKTCWSHWPEWEKQKANEECEHVNNDVFWP